MRSPDGATLSRVHRGAVAFLERHLPEVLGAVRAVEPGFKVVPFSGLGRPPERDAASGSMRILPSAVRPTWAAVPFVVALAEALPAALPEYRYDTQA